MPKKKNPREVKQPTPSMLEIYGAILAMRTASLYGEHWVEAARILAPMALGEQLSEMLQHFDLSKHPECRELYEVVAHHNRTQAGLAKAKMVAVNALSTLAVESPRLDTKLNTATTRTSTTILTTITAAKPVVPSKPVAKPVVPSKQPTPTKKRNESTGCCIYCGRSWVPGDAEQLGPRAVQKLRQSHTIRMKHVIRCLDREDCAAEAAWVQEVAADLEARGVVRFEDHPSGKCRYILKGNGCSSMGLCLNREAARREAAQHHVAVRRNCVDGPGPRWAVGS